jgi:hypothetical protein
VETQHFVATVDAETIKVLFITITHSYFILEVIYDKEVSFLSFHFYKKNSIGLRSTIVAHNFNQIRSMLHLNCVYLIF